MGAGYQLNLKKVVTPLLPTAQIRAIEQTHGTDGLMEQAGRAVAELASSLVNPFYPAILLLAGPGNNGGDAFVAARYLKQHWHALSVVFADDANQLPPDARHAYEGWLACGGRVQPDILPGNYGLVIDGLFGIGLTRPLQGVHAELIAQANALPAPKLSIDIPSGLCADTGRVLGCAFRADITLSFIARKPGLHTQDGPDFAGKVLLDTLGLDFPTQPPGCLVDTCPALPAKRLRNSHKGLYGNAAVLGGAEGMVGAALLAARSALLAGSGRVSGWLLAQNAPIVDMAYPELMLPPASAAQIENFSGCIVAGPGMGRDKPELLAAALGSGNPLVLDADALHLLANSPGLKDTLRTRGNAVLTPHPGEAAMLLGTDTATIQADRIHSAQSIAAEYNAVTVLKGCGSIIATPDGRWFINGSGNPGLSSAGMGDVLAGLIGALVAQGLNPEESALAGVYLHGAAADQLVLDGTGQAGLTASEVAEEIRQQINRGKQ